MASNPIRTAPVATLTTVEAALGAVLSLLVAHHVIPTGVAETYGPLVVAALVALFGAVKWQNVTPVVKAQALAGKLAAEIADAQTSPAVQAVEQAVLAAVTPVVATAQAGAPQQSTPESAPLVQGTLAPPQTPPVPAEPAAAPATPTA